MVEKLKPESNKGMLLPNEEKPIDFGPLISNHNNKPKLQILFGCPECKTKKYAYLLPERDTEDAEYTYTVCSGCNGMFELRMGLDPKLVPPLNKEPTR